jgi:hypothetical protein
MADDRRNVNIRCEPNRLQNLERPHHGDVDHSSAPFRQAYTRPRKG